MEAICFHPTEVEDRTMPGRQRSSEGGEHEWRADHRRHPRCLGGQRRHHQLLAVLRNINQIPAVHLYIGDIFKNDTFWQLISFLRVYTFFIEGVGQRLLDLM